MIRRFVQQLGSYVLFISLGSVSVLSIASPLGETREIIFSGEGIALQQKADELKSPAAIYEHVRNTHEHALYHGSRSNTINTFLGQRGSDVDIASVLIALYRSQNMPARYAMATVSAPATEVANWLGVKNVNLAAAIMDDQGIQNVNLTTDGATQVIEFEHAWVQVQVPYDNYRGAFASTVDCTAAPSQCEWINVDPSWKSRQFHNQGIDVYNVVNFDYTGYYNAIKDDNEFRDKSPLEIYEEQILDWLKINHPGKTLNDVADPGVINVVQDGILPASLPYKVISNIATYDTIEAHDAANDPDWAKQVKLTLTFGPGIRIDMGTYFLADLATGRLTLTYELGTEDRLIARLDGVETAVPLVGGTLVINGTVVDVGFPFELTADLDGAPATQAGESDNIITVQYNNLIVGGYYLIGIGGDTSNWSQVHRAAEQLLDANEAFPIVFNSDETGCLVGGQGCTPYVDSNNNGFDVSDARLLDSPAAQDDLTGGLLYVAMSQYFTKFREGVRRLDALNHVISPIEGFIGIVSSTHEVEYLGETAFSVMPGGLLIDMKGQSFTGSWRVDAPDTFADEHFEFVGHRMSALEHEIWQALTGFDAVSTMRGIQMALAGGAPLQTPENTGSGNNMVSQYSGFQFGDSVPSGFSYTPFTVFSTQPAAWTHATADAKMELLRRNVNSSHSPIERALGTYRYNPTNGLYGWVQCVNSFEDQLLTFPPTDDIQPFTFCDGTQYSGQASTVLSQIENRYLTHIIPNEIGQTVFDFFDRAKGFNPADVVYRALPLATNQHSGARVQNIRDDVMIGDRITINGVNGGRWEYVIPGLKTEGALFRFSVFLEKIFNPTSGHLISQSYLINNESFVAGGGWVDGSEALLASEAVPGASVIQPTFDNEVFTDQNLVAQTNNDLIRTPSTADPVSTVTGNMYHDETDVTITGRGLNYAFTRSYNSGPARANQDGPLGFGWTHSYNMSLRSNDYGKCPNCTTEQAAENGNGIPSSITYIDERGGEHTYILNADSAGTRSVAENPPGEFDTLQLNTPAAGQHTLVFRNGASYVFEQVGTPNLLTSPDSTARLSGIEDPYANRLTMGYGDSGRLTGITDNLAIPGRTGLTLTYHGTTQHIHTLSDWTGRTWTYLFDGDGNLDSIENPLGQVMDYTYHPDTHLLNELIKPQDRNGQKAKTAFAYYRNNKAFNYANTLGETETLDYDLYRQRTQVTDPRGFIREHFYDKDNGALIKLTEPDGAILRFENNADGLRFSKTDGLGFETQYSFMADRSVASTASDNAGRVSREIDPLNQSTDLDYGLYDQPTTSIDKRRNPTTRVYYQTTDAATGAVQGKPKEIRATINGQPDVLLRSFTYYTEGAAFGQLKQQIEYLDAADISRQRITDFVYETNGINLQSLMVSGNTSGGSIVRSFTYDALSRVETDTLTRRTSATDATPLSLTTTFDHDALGRVTSVTDPRGDRRETVFDDNGKVTQEKVHYLTDKTRPNCSAPTSGFVTCTYVTNRYDAADRLIERTDLLGHSTTFRYDESGNLISQTDANGHITRFEYDTMNRRTAVIDANGHRTEMAYDLAGRLIYIVDPNGHRTTNTYDALGRLIKITTEEGRETVFGYDAGNNQTHLTDANALVDPAHPRNSEGVSSFSEFDEFNRQIGVLDALNGETVYTYDLFGNITSITDAQGQITQFLFDDLGRMIETIDPVIEAGADKTDRVLLYDETGNALLTEDRSGRQRRHTYDILGRRTKTEYLADATEDTFGFDDFGDLVTLSNADVTYRYTYTSRHELKSKTDTRLNKSLRWTYDPVGNVSTKTDYQGAVTHFQYDSDNSLVALENSEFLQVSYHSDPAGRLLNRILSNGAQTDYRFDDDNRLIQLTNRSADGTVVEDLIYQHDAVGNIIHIVDSVSGRTVIYDLDALYRLTGVDSSLDSDDRSYTYDKIGNRKTLTENGSTFHYCYHLSDCNANPQGNRLINIRRDSATGPLHRQFQYDDSGRMTHKQDGAGADIYTITYNGKGRASQINGNRFGYDANDYRIRKDSKQYHLEGEHLEATYGNDGTLQARYLRGVVVDEIVNGFHHHSADPNDWTNFTFHHDHINSVTALTGHIGSIEESTRYDVFGAPLNLANPGTGNDLLYTGRELDRDTGLYYYRARYYDPETGRFVSEDPLGFASGDTNFYVYCANGPIDCNDPSGNAGALVPKLVQKAIDRAVGKTGGRLGKPETRVFNSIEAQKSVDEGFELVAGGGVLPESLIKSTVKGKLVRAFPDATLQRGNETRFINTVSTLADGKTLTKVEAANASKIRQISPNAELLLVPKPKPGTVFAGGALVATSGVAGASDGGSQGGGFLNTIGDFFKQDAVPLLLDLLFGVGSAEAPTVNSGVGAGGGFVLYPNKPNTNILNSVYSK